MAFRLFSNDFIEGGTLPMKHAIDKIRAEFPGGNLGQYVVMGNDGATVTGRFCRATGITHSELVDAVKSAPDDAGVAVWLHARLDAKTIADWNDSYYQTTIGHIKGPLRVCRIFQDRRSRA